MKRRQARKVAGLFLGKPPLSYRQTTIFAAVRKVGGIRKKDMWDAFGGCVGELMCQAYGLAMSPSDYIWRTP